MDVFEFTWKPLYGKGKMWVQTWNRKLMDMFLIQHGFNKDTNSVTVSVQEADNDCCSLEIYKFGSRERDKFYYVATTGEIMMEFISEVSLQLSSAMYLGACALKCDFEIFARVEQLVSKLDHVMIGETLMSMEGELDEYYGYRHPGYPYSPTYEEVSRDDQVDALSEDLLVNSYPYDYNKRPVPYTIESYISFFTNNYLIGEEYKKNGKTGETVR